MDPEALNAELRQIVADFPSVTMQAAVELARQGRDSTKTGTENLETLRTMAYYSEISGEVPNHELIQSLGRLDRYMTVEQQRDLITWVEALPGDPSDFFGEFFENTVFQLIEKTGGDAAAVQDMAAFMAAFPGGWSESTQFIESIYANLYEGNAEAQQSVLDLFAFATGQNATMADFDAMLLDQGLWGTLGTMYQASLQEGAPAITDAFNPALAGFFEALYGTEEAIEHYGDVHQTLADETLTYAQKNALLQEGLAADYAEIQANLGTIASNLKGKLIPFFEDDVALLAEVTGLIAEGASMGEIMEALNRGSPRQRNKALEELNQYEDALMGAGVLPPAEDVGPGVYRRFPQAPMPDDAPSARSRMEFARPMESFDATPKPVPDRPGLFEWFDDMGERVVGGVAAAREWMARPNYKGGPVDFEGIYGLETPYRRATTAIQRPPHQQFDAGSDYGVRGGAGGPYGPLGPMPDSPEYLGNYNPFTGDDPFGLQAYERWRREQWADDSPHMEFDPGMGVGGRGGTNPYGPAGAFPGSASLWYERRRRAGWDDRGPHQAFGPGADPWAARMRPDYAGVYDMGDGEYRRNFGVFNPYGPTPEAAWAWQLFRRMQWRDDSPHMAFDPGQSFGLPPGGGGSTPFSDIGWAMPGSRPWWDMRRRAGWASDDPRMSLSPGQDLGRLTGGMAATPFSNMLGAMPMAMQAVVERVQRGELDPGIAYAMLARGGMTGTPYSEAGMAMDSTLLARVMGHEPGTMPIDMGAISGAVQERSGGGFWSGTLVGRLLDWLDRDRREPRVVNVDNTYNIEGGDPETVRTTIEEVNQALWQTVGAAADTPEAEAY